MGGFLQSNQELTDIESVVTYLKNGSWISFIFLKCKIAKIYILFITRQTSSINPLKSILSVPKGWKL